MQKWQFLLSFCTKSSGVYCLIYIKKFLLFEFPFFYSFFFAKQYRNQLSLQQDARLHLQREALHQRQAELRSVDQRIYELQSRLQKKKAANISQTFQNQMKSNQLHLMNQLNQTDHPQKLQSSQFNHQNAENINYTNNNGVVLQFVNNTQSNTTAATSNK